MSQCFKLISIWSQVKCPECRAEHRVPYNGIQGFPANVTLQRFLDAHIEITGEAPDPHTGEETYRDHGGGTGPPYR